MHAVGVVHSDLKPANVLVSQDRSVVKVCDIGLSRIKTSLGTTRTHFMIPDTTMYMSPEGLVCHIMPNKQEDMWSMSATHARHSR